MGKDNEKIADCGCPVETTGYFENTTRLLAFYQKPPFLVFSKTKRSNHDIDNPSRTHEPTLHGFKKPL